MKPRNLKLHAVFARDEIEQRARIAKLDAERRLAEHQLSPQTQARERLKVWGGISGLLAALVALVGITLSTYQWFQTVALDRALRTDERLDRALALLGSNSESGRLAGVVSLSSFLQHNDSSRTLHALQALTKQLALEPSPVIRNSILNAFEDMPTAAAWRPMSDQALVSLMQASRGLISEGRLWSNRHAEENDVHDPAVAEARAIAVRDAIIILLRKGARTKDMSRVYLVGGDLSSLQLKEVSFANSILASSNFERAHLTKASFANADLDSASFESANLQGANFTQVRQHRDNYVLRQMRESVTGAATPIIDAHVIRVDGPSFQCADLRDADFTGHSLVEIVPDDIGQQLQVFNTSFRGANLTGAQFSKLQAFGLRRKGHVSFFLPFLMRSAMFPFPDDKHMYFIGEIGDDTWLKHGTEYDKGLDRLSFLFANSSWDKARMFPALRMALLRTKTSTDVSSESCN